MSHTETSIAPLLASAVRAFEARFGRRPTMASAAPGRVNLIGEHTDYNGGHVLPVAIDRWAVAVADKATDPSSVLHSLDLDEEYEADLTGPLQRVDLDWANYPLGVADAFARNGAPLANVDLALTSSIPIGGGLSSSAAINVAVAGILEQATGNTLDPETKAKWCQEAEHSFPDVPCGIMDPMIACCAEAEHALLINCSTNEGTLVRMPAPDRAVLVIANTNVRHALGTAEYGLRRAECETATAYLNTHGQSAVHSLCEATLAGLEDIREKMNPILYRRARHVVTENLRTIRATEAMLDDDDLDALGKLMFQSHVSLRDDYEVSCPELDALVELAGEFSKELTGRDRGVYGARMTGGGFGGCTITLCRPDVVDVLTKHLIDGHRARFDTVPTIFTTPAVGGAHAPSLDGV